MPNEREWALLIWSCVLAGVVMSRPGVRASIRNVFTPVFGSSLRVLLLLLVAWVSMEVLAASALGLWTPALTTGTATWFFVSGLALFFRFGSAACEPHFFRRQTLRIFEVSLVLEVLLSLFVFGLVVELILLPAITALTLLAIVTERSAEHVQVKKFAESLLALIGFGVLAFVVIKTVGAWRDVQLDSVLREFAQPIWLTLGALPFVYAVALYAGYEATFRHIDWRSPGRGSTRVKTKIALLTHFHLKAHELGAFTASWQSRLAEATTIRDARAVIRACQRDRELAEQETQRSLEREREFAGLDGIDERGGRLDQRGFEETRDALYWLATCMMGWYRRESRYREDLLTSVLGDDFSRQGLAGPSGIRLRVSSDRQSWFAWRRVSNWCLAIGAAGPPPDQWLYDGPEPPNGFPGDDQCWGPSALDSLQSPNW